MDAERELEQLKKAAAEHAVTAERYASMADTNVGEGKVGNLFMGKSAAFWRGAAAAYNLMSR